VDEIAEEARQWCRDGDEDPEECREDKSYNGHCLKRDGDGMNLVEMDLNAGDVGNQLDAANDHSGQQKGHDGERADADEQQIDGARDPLAMAAVCAFGEVMLVVRAHCGRETRYVVTPARENVSYYLINT
jgi:hypothetical protein